jgi:hypothetical protein
MMLLGWGANRAVKDWRALVTLSVLLAVYLFGRWLFDDRNFLSDIIAVNKNLVFYLASFGLLSWLFSFYEKAQKNKNMHFAAWLFFGVILTIILKGSLLMIR